VIACVKGVETMTKVQAILEDLIEAAARHDDACAHEMGTAIARLVATFCTTDDVPVDLMVAAIEEQATAFRAVSGWVSEAGEA
jgi:hypothetical protein